MNKNIVSALALASMLVLLGGCNEEKQPQKPAPQFGVVQISKLYQDSQFGKAGVERMKQIEEKAVAMLKDAQAEMEKVRAAGNEEEASRLEGNLQTHVYFIQEAIKHDQDHVMNVMQTAMKKVFNKYSQEHGLFGVFSADTMLAASPEADVTTAVQAMLDSEKPDFGPLPSLEMPKLPEPANADPRDEAPAEKAESAAEAPAAPAEAPATK